MHLVNGLLSASWAVLFVCTIRIIVANESEFELGDLVMLSDRQGADITEGLEQLSDFFLGLFDRDVFHVDVVDDLSEMSSVSWLELNGNDTFWNLGLECLAGATFVLEADEAIASGGVVWVSEILRLLILPSASYI